MANYPIANKPVISGYIDVIYIGYTVLVNLDDILIVELEPFPWPFLAIFADTVLGSLFLLRLESYLFYEPSTVLASGDYEIIPIDAC